MVNKNDLSDKQKESLIIEARKLRIILGLGDFSDEYLLDWILTYIAPYVLTIDLGESKVTIIARV
jgi:hypothetical protein